MLEPFRQLCRRSGAREQRVDGAQDRLAPGPALLVAPQGLEIRGIEGAHQGDDLLGLELVVLGRGGSRPARACALGSGRTAPARDDVPDRFGGPVAAHDAGAAAQELLHLALVAVAVAVALA